MERIRKALERAGQERATRPDYRSPGHDVIPADLATGIHYTMTRQVEVPQSVLLENRLIAALPEHPHKDAYRMLRTRVLQTLRNNGWNTLAVTGPATGCGKSLTAINLAISLAMEITHTVLLVDLDLRNPSIHEYFGFRPEKGLNDYLFDHEISLHEVLVAPGIERLVILPGRSAVPNSAEMLRSPRMVSLVTELKTRYPDRLIIFDLPPILAADDALAFSPYVDALLMVAECGGTSKEDLERAYDIVKSTPLVGTVLNKSDHPSTGYGYASRGKKKRSFWPFGRARKAQAA